MRFSCTSGSAPYGETGHAMWMTSLGRASSTSDTSRAVARASGRHNRHAAVPAPRVPVLPSESSTIGIFSGRPAPPACLFIVVRRERRP